MPGVIQNSASYRIYDIENERFADSIDSGDMDGDIVEGAVAAVLWDIVDDSTARDDGSPGSDDDGVQGQFVSLWNVFRDYRPDDIHGFWNGWFATGYGYRSQMNVIFWEQRIDKNTSPSCTIISPNTGGWYKGTISVVASASDSDGAVSRVDFEFSLDSTTWYTIGSDTYSGDGWSISWNTGTITDPTVWVRTHAYDSMEWSGWDTSDSSFGVDNALPNPPSISSDPSHCPPDTWTTHNSPYFTWGDPGDSGSGTSSYEGSVNDGTPFPVSSPYHPTWGDGIYKFKVRAVDGVGNRGTWSNVITVKIDTSAPIGSISINSGATYTTSTSVTLTLSAVDGSGSGAAYMCFSNDGYSWSSWDYYGTSKYWTLASGDGTKTVYVKFKDFVGFESSAASDTIILDTTPPTGSITIAGGAPYTTTTAVTLTLSASDTNGVAQMRFSNDGSSWSDWYLYSTSASWNLASGDGTKTVYVQFKDNPGLVSSYYPDTIILDMTQPTGSISIDGGAIYSTSTSVSLTLTYGDATSGVYQVRYSNDGSAYTVWEAPSITKAWTLLSGEGTKTVYYQVKDNAGNIATFTDTILLDTTPPTGSISIDAGAAYATSTSVSLTLSATDTGSGVFQMCFSNDGSTWSGWEPYATSKSWTLTSGDGAKTVYAKYKDNAGLESSVSSDTIILDTVPPTGTISINNDAAYAASTSVMLTLSASDAGSGVFQMCFSNDGSTWSGWEPYATSKSWILTAAEGTKTVYVQFKDNAGSISTAYSDTIVLDTTPSSSPTLLSPSDGATVSRKPTFIWSLATDATSGIASYTFQLDTSPAFNSGQLITVAGIITTNYTPDQLLDEGTWYWHVCATDNAGNIGPYSTTWSIAVQTSVSITFQVSGVGGDASGTVLSIDGKAYTYSQLPVLFTWTVGSAHSVLASSPISGSAGKRYIWVSWTNGDGLGGQSGTYTAPSSDETVIANYATQYNVTFKQIGLDNTVTSVVVTINGSAKYYDDLPNSTWVDSGKDIVYSYESIVSSSSPEDKRFRLGSITGPISPITVSEAVGVTGIYVAQYNVTFTQTGLDNTASSTVVVVNGSAKSYGDLSCSVWVDGGAKVFYSYESTVLSSVSGKRFSLVSVSGSPSPITVTTSTTATGNYKTQYYLTITTNYGTVIPSSGWFDAGSNVTISANAPSVNLGEQYVWKGWIGSGTGSYTGLNNPSFVIMDGPINETASWTHQYLLTVKTNGLPSSYPTNVYLAGTPVGTSSDTSSFTRWFDEGTSTGSIGVDGTVTGATGTRYIFTKWVEDNSTINPRAFESMDGPKNFTARYKTQYKLSVFSDHDSPAPSVGEHWYDTGTEVTASVTSPADESEGTRYSCTGWTGTGSVPASGSSTSAAFTINMASSITWNWKTQYQLTISVSPPGSGSTNPAASSYWYDSGFLVSVTATPSSGYAFDNWTLDGNYAGSSNPISASMTISPHTLEAKFKTATVTIGFEVSGISSDVGMAFILTIDATPYNLYQLPVQFTWTIGSMHTVAASDPVSAGSGKRYVWMSWTNGDGLSGPSGTYTVPSSSQAVTANYKTQYQLTVFVDPSGGGATSPAAGSYWYDAGSSVAINATANAGYIFQGWTLDGSDVGSANTVWVTMNGPHNLVANFTIFFECLSLIESKVIESSTDTTWFIFGSDTLAPQGYAAEMDALSSQLLYGMCTNEQNYAYDKKTGLLLPNGRPNPATIPGGSSIILFGGPGASKAVAYYENNQVYFNPGTLPADIAPLRMRWDASYYWFELKDGSQVPNSKVPKASIGPHQDYFLIEAFVDSAGRFVYIAYGYNRYGTNLAAFYMKDEICPNMHSYIDSWYIFHWQDLDNDRVLDLGEVTNVGSGRVAQGVGILDVGSPDDNQAVAYGNWIYDISGYTDWSPRYTIDGRTVRDYSNNNGAWYHASFSMTLLDSTRDYFITIVYKDSSMETIYLEAYDGSTYYRLGTIVGSGSGQWKSITFTLPKAYIFDYDYLPGEQIAGINQLFHLVTSAQHPANAHPIDMIVLTPG